MYVHERDENTFLCILTHRLQTNGIGDEGARSLAVTLRDNGSLVELFLQVLLQVLLYCIDLLLTLGEQHNHMGEGGARAIAEALKRNGGLTALYLGVRM